MITFRKATLALLSLVTLISTAGIVLQATPAAATTSGWTPYTNLGGNTFVVGGAPTAASFVRDITSSHAAIALDKEGLSPYLGAIRARAELAGNVGFRSCTMRIGQRFLYMSGGTSTVTVEHDVIFEDSRYPNGAPAWCETVNTTASGRHVTIQLMVPKKCGNIGLISVTTTVVAVTHTPVFTCNSLTVFSTTGTTASATVGFTARYVASPRVSIRWATSGPDDVTTAATIHTGSSATATHTYSQSGRFTVTARLTVDVGGRVRTVSSGSCTKTVTIPPSVASASYSCNSLTVTATTGTSATATVGFAASGVTSEGVSIQWAASGPDEVTTAATITGTGTATATHTFTQPGTYTVIAQLSVMANGVSASASGPNCTTTVTIPSESPTPVYTCDSLAVTPTSGTSVFATVGFTATHVTDVDVTIQWSTSGADAVTTDAQNSGNGTATASHTYSAADTYTVTATLSVMVDGVPETASGPNCTTPVTVPATSPTPVFSCDSLTVTPTTGNAVAATVGYTVQNVTNVGVSLQWAASGTDDVTTAATLGGGGTATASHTYSAAGTYTVTATLSVDANGTPETSSGEHCTTTVTVPSTCSDESGQGSEGSQGGQSCTCDVNAGTPHDDQGKGDDKCTTGSGGEGGGQCGTDKNAGTPHDDHGKGDDTCTTGSGGEGGGQCGTDKNAGTPHDDQGKGDDKCTTGTGGEGGGQCSTDKNAGTPHDDQGKGDDRCVVSSSGEKGRHGSGDHTDHSTGSIQVVQERRYQHNCDGDREAA